MHEDLLPYFDVIEMSVKGLGNTSGEIGINGITKATGMASYLKYKAIKREDSIAIGDGTNDFEMVEFAGVGVAMGNGFDELKARADMVTRSIDDDGIYYAFKELGLI
jgi:hydroxymethylpyrimidine pyrophosphatase-like HAD family hydrolase